MYRISPFTYLVSGVLSVGLAHAPVNCALNEILRFNPPSAQTCAEYLSPYIQRAGGKVLNPSATEQCEFCSIASTDAFLKTIYADYGGRWRNFGLMWVYIIFNVFGAVALYWLLRVPKNKKKKKKKMTKKE